MITRDACRHLRVLLCAAMSCYLAHAAHAQETAPPPATDPSEATHVSAHLGVAAGLSMREQQVPSFEGVRSLSSGLTPAMQLSLCGRWRADTRHLDLLRSYQSSVHARARDRAGDPMLMASEASIRSHRFEAGLKPGLALSRASLPAELGLFLGYAVRAFGSVETLRIPRFSLHGPLLRAELRLPLASWLRLSLAPEAQLVISMSHDLRELAGLPRSTWGLGAQAALEASLSSAWTLGLSYRESHVRATGSEGRLWQDVERYALVGLFCLVE